MLIKNVSVTKNKYNFDSPESEMVKTLGLQFNPIKDKFYFNIQPFVNSITERTALSHTGGGGEFESLGFFESSNSYSKNLSSKNVIRKLDWDDEISLQERKTWNKYREELKELKNLKIRHVLWPNSQHVDLIGFENASKDAYGFVVHL